MATLTIETLDSLSPRTLSAILRCIYSPASGAGRVLSALLDGRTIAPCGPGHVPANRSRKRAPGAAQKTLDIFGPNSAASSTSGDLQWSLENRLRARPFGSTLCSLTWRRFATPSGRPFCRLLASVRRTKETASGLLPTPTRAQYGTANNGNPHDGRTEYRTKGKPSLSTMARTGLWPTPTAGDAEASGSRNTPSSSAKPGLSLTDAVRADGGTGRLWPTPIARDSRTIAGAKSKPGQEGTEGLIRQVAKAEKATSGALNPAFVAWLMGYPPEWVSCAPSVMPSSRKSRPSSSPHIAKQSSFEGART